MAFGLRRGGSRDAGVVRLTADTGEFNAKVEAAERQWRESTASMSREALKLDLAQDRLKRSLAQYGAESNQAKRATIALKDAEEAATRSAHRLDSAHDRTRRGLVSLRSAVGAAIGVGGLYGLAAGIRTVVGAAQESEMVLGQTSVAVEAAGLSWESYGDRVEKALSKQSKALAFDDEDLARSFQTFVRQTKDVDEALRRNEIAADVARGRYMSLEQATLLVTKAALGQAGALRRVGIDTKGVTDGVGLLKLLTEQYGQSAEKAATESQAASDRWHVSLENLQETLGDKLLPTFNDYIGRLTSYVDKAEESGELQERVNRVLSDAESVLKGLAGGLRVVKEAAEPVVDALGGIEKAAQLALIVGVVSKIRRAAGSFGALQLASRSTAAKGVADATAFGRAWDIATRPRNMVVTTTATGVPGGGNRPAPAPAPGRGRPSLPPIGFNLPTIAAGAVIAAGGASGARQGSYTPQRYPRVARLIRKLEAGGRLTANERSAISEFGGRSISELSPAQLARLEANLVGQSTAPGLGGDRDRPNMGRAVSQPARPTAGGGTDKRSTGDGLTPLQRATLAASEAELTPSRQDDLREARRIESIYARRVANENLKGDALFQARQDLNAARARTQSIEDQIAADEQQAEETAAANRRANAAKVKATRAKAAAEEKSQREAFERHNERRRKALLKGELGDKLAMNRPPDPRFRRPSATTTADGGLTVADIRRLQVEFLQGLQGVTNQFGSNVSADGAQVATNTWQTSRLMMEQNRMIDRLTRGVAHPGAKHARNELMLGFGSGGGV